MKFYHTTFILSDYDSYKEHHFIVKTTTMKYARKMIKKYLKKNGFWHFFKEENLKIKQIPFTEGILEIK